MSTRAKGRPPRSGVRRGRTALAGALAIVAVFVVPPVGGASLQGLAAQVPAQGAETSAASAAPTGPPSFRADRWSLPDDALLGFVPVPDGILVMGSDPEADPLSFENEVFPGPAPQLRVEYPGFYIGRYEVTVGQFRAFVEATGHPADPQALQGSPDLPVAWVSWPDALAYARWLDMQLRASPQTPAPLRQALERGGEVTLPTEAQWERAARGGDARIFPWGDVAEIGGANFSSTGRRPVGAVGCPRCAFGIADMAGNVWEYTASPYRPYPYSDDPVPENLEADALWVMRGGGYADVEQTVRAAVRGGADPGVRRDFIGFRLVITVPGGLAPPGAFLPPGD